jgi:hypothetical protein
MTTLQVYLVMKNKQIIIVEVNRENDGLDCFTLRVRNDGDMRRVTSEGAA